MESGVSQLIGLQLERIRAWEMTEWYNAIHAEVLAWEEGNEQLWLESSVLPSWSLTADPGCLCALMHLVKCAQQRQRLGNVQFGWRKRESIKQFMNKGSLEIKERIIQVLWLLCIHSWAMGIFLINGFEFGLFYPQETESVPLIHSDWLCNNSCSTGKKLRRKVLSQLLEYVHHIFSEQTS